MSVGNLGVVLELDGADNFITTVNRAASAVSGLTNNVNNTVTVINNIRQPTLSAADSMARLVVVLGQAKQAFEFLKSATTDWVMKIVDANAKMETLMLLLKGISTATTEIGRTNEALGNFNYLIDKASSSPFSLGKLTDAFVKLKGAGIEPVEKTLNSMADAVAHFGGNDQTLDRVALAIQQMSGKGVVSMEELRRQLGDAVPGAMKAMASAMNLTMGQLVSAVTKGTLESKNAIALMTAEFDRLYGGAAAQKLQSYTGQLSLMTTSFQRLALVAGGMGANGEYAEGSFFKNITENLKQFNEYLKTPEITAYAVTINRALNDIVNGVVNAAKFFHEWGGVIVSVGSVVLQFIVVMKALDAAMALQTAVAGNAVIRNIITNLGSLTTIAGAAISTTGTLIARYAVWSFSLQTGLTGALSSMGALQAMTTALVAIPFTSLIGALTFLAAPVAVVAGIAAITYALTNLENRSKLASDALDRIKQGDLTRGNEAVAKTQLEALDARIANLQAIKSKIDQVNNGQIKKLDPAAYEATLSAEAINLPMSEVAGSGHMAPLPMTPKNASDDIQVKYTAEVNRALTALVADREALAARLASVPLERIKMEANNQFESLKQSLDLGLQPERNRYRMAIEALDKKAADLGTGLDNESLEKRGAINSDKARTRQNIYDVELSAIDGVVEAQQQKLDAALQAQDDTATVRITAVIAKFKAYRAEVEQSAAAAAANSGKVVVLSADKEIERRVKEAQNYMQQMQARIAANEAEAAGASGSLAKMVEWLDKAGKWKGIDDEAKASLMALSQQLSESETKLKSFKEATKAGEQIDMGLSKANADLERYTSLITDPTAAEGKRSFEMLSLSMSRAVDVLKKALEDGGIQATEFDRRMAQVNETLRIGAASAAMSDAQRLIAESNSKWVASLPPMQRFAETQAQTLKKIGDARAALKKSLEDNAIKPEAYNAAITGLNTAETQTNNTRDNRESRAGAGAARAAENAVTNMTGRIAQLKAQLEGSNGELAKWNAELARGKYAGQADAIRGLAAEHDRLAEAVKRATAAKQAELNLKKGLEDSKDNLDDLRALDQQTEKLGKMTGQERELWDFKRRVNKEVNQVEDYKPVAGTNFDQAAYDRRVADAKSTANLRVSTEATSYSMKAMAENKSETDQILKSVETSLSKRRAAGYEEVANFEASQRRIIASSQASTDERARMETTLAATVSAKRLQVERQTENGLEKWMRESMDMSTQMSNFGASAFSQINDALTNMASTGKFSFTDLANWAIKELTRITLSQAFATLMKSVMGAAGGAGGGGGMDWGSVIGSVVGAFSGVSTGATGYDMAGNVGAGFYGPAGPGGKQYHTGGIVGHEGAARAMSMSFANLPRFHTGTYLKSDEQAAVLQKGEAVFTAGQLSAIGRLNHSYSVIEANMGAISSAVAGASSQPRVPSSMAPAVPMNPADGVGASGGGGGGNVTVNMHNQTGQDATATASAPRFDGEQMVIDVVLKNVSRPGPLRNAMMGLGKV